MSNELYEKHKPVIDTVLKFLQPSEPQEPNRIRMRKPLMSDAEFQPLMDKYSSEKQNYDQYKANKPARDNLAEEIRSAKDPTYLSNKLHEACGKITQADKKAQALAAFNNAAQASILADAQKTLAERVAEHINETTGIQGPANTSLTPGETYKIKLNRPATYGGTDNLVTAFTKGQGNKVTITVNKSDNPLTTMFERNDARVKAALGFGMKEASLSGLDTAALERVKEGKGTPGDKKTYDQAYDLAMKMSRAGIKVDEDQLSSFKKDDYKKAKDAYAAAPKPPAPGTPAPAPALTPAVQHQTPAQTPAQPPSNPAHIR